MLVEFAPGIRVGLRFFQMEQELSDILGTNVELHTRGFLSSYFSDRVLTEAEVQYEQA